MNQRYNPPQGYKLVPAKKGGSGCLKLFGLLIILGGIGIGIYIFALANKTHTPPPYNPPSHNSGTDINYNETATVKAPAVPTQISRNIPVSTATATEFPITSWTEVEIYAHHQALCYNNDYHKKYPNELGETIYNYGSLAFEGGGRVPGSAPGQGVSIRKDITRLFIKYPNTITCTITASK